MTLTFPGGTVEVVADWPEEHPSGVTPTTLTEHICEKPWADPERDICDACLRDSERADEEYAAKLNAAWSRDIMPALSDEARLEQEFSKRPCLLNELSEPCGPDGYCWRHERAVLVAKRYLRMKGKAR